MPAPDDEIKPPMAETVAMGPMPPAAALPARYEVLGELGRGGMGIVYKARDRETGEVLALKVLKPEIAADSRILERFKDELLLAHKITHRNVARLNEFHRAGDMVYLSMEFVEGESLRALLNRQGKLDAAEGIPIARQLVAGLAEAHRQSIVHRDLKPENIMLTAGGELKVMDFGISRSYAAGATQTGSIIGTPAYMSPEQAEGKPADHRADIYATGLILYEMFTGSPAFSGDTPVSVALKQIRERPTQPATLAPGLPKNIERTILKCLEKDPAKRFQSIEEVLLGLEGDVPAPHARRRSPRPVLVGGLAAVLIAASALAFWWWRGRNSDSIRFPLEQFTLANGLPVVLSVDHAAPSFTLAAVYKGGARTDKPGHTGLAHLVEHLMDEGSANVAQDEYFSVVTEAGGNMGDDTLADISYFVTNLPANQLEMALFLESDRMRGLEITQAGLNAARTHLLEELRNRENTPYQLAILHLRELVFDNYANGRSGFGSPADLNAVTIEEAANFHRTYYVPSNAALALVGDFDPKVARERIRHYFEDIPARPAPPLPDTREPAGAVAKRETMIDPAIQVPVVLLAWRTPPFSNPDRIALRSLRDLLGANDTSRLKASLKGAGLASYVEVHLEESAGPDVFWIALIAAPGKDLNQLESSCLEQIDRVAREGVPKDELERLITDDLRQRALSLVPTLVRGLTIAQFLGEFGHVEMVNEWEATVRGITSDGLRRVAKQYLTPGSMAVLTVQPGGGRAQ